MKKWAVRKRVGDKWELVGVYSENFVEQIGAAVANLTKQGYVMYDSIRVEEMPEKEQAANG